MKVSESCKIVLMASEEYQYATVSAYSPTMSEIPHKCEFDIHVSATRHTEVD